MLPGCRVLRMVPPSSATRRRHCRSRSITCRGSEAQSMNASNVEESRLPSSFRHRAAIARLSTTHHPRILPRLLIRRGYAVANTGQGTGQRKRCRLRRVRAAMRRNCWTRNPLERHVRDLDRAPSMLRGTHRRLLRRGIDRMQHAHNRERLIARTRPGGLLMPPSPSLR